MTLRWPVLRRYCPGQCVERKLGHRGRLFERVDDMNIYVGARCAVSYVMSNSALRYQHDGEVMGPEHFRKADYMIINNISRTLLRAYCPTLMHLEIPVPGT